MSGISFIRKAGRIIPIRSGITNIKKANIANEISSLGKLSKKVNSPFIKENIVNKIRELSEKFKLLEHNI